ncbi:MAG TPA: aldehyde reductase [Mucilaginibacter sp.]|nr:aldehyde reductase [Mucilaginibacter sp.]
MMNAIGNKTVLVTGGTGFVGAHCILQLLQKGYRVKTTLRSAKRKDEVMSMLRYGGITSFENLSFIEADLTSDRNWDEAAAGCDYVLHVASPIFLRIPEHENEMIVPAVEGTIRVLRAAKKTGVSRVVLTSSFGAVGYSHHDPETMITEEDWTDPNNKSLSAYLKSKTLAEKAAWDFMAKEGGDMELSVINPMAILGPSLGPDMSSGFELLKRVMNGSMKAVPNIMLGIVDVRDVADLHIRAMTDPMAKGQRFLALAGGVMSLPEIAKLIKNKMGNDARNISTRVLPDWIVRLAALFSPTAKILAPQVGRSKNASNKKARELLGWAPRPNEEAILATAHSLVAFGQLTK